MACIVMDSHLDQSLLPRGEKAVGLANPSSVAKELPVKAGSCGVKKGIAKGTCMEV